jgi:hypothetical protein
MWCLTPLSVATLGNEKLLKCASDNDLLLCRKSTSNKTRCRQWFDRCITSKMILKSGSNLLFPVVFSVEITLSGSHSGNSFEFSHRLTDFLNYALFCLSLNLKKIINLTHFLKSFWMLYIDQIIVYNAFYSKLTFYIIKDRCQMHTLKVFRSPVWLLLHKLSSPHYHYIRKMRRGDRLPLTQKCIFNR